MNKRFISFLGFRIETGIDWEDITDILDLTNKPFTIAKRDGVGALQFSPALYRCGPVPAPNKDELLLMAIELGLNRGLGEAFDTDGFEGSLAGGSASYHSENDFIRVWYLSDKRNIMLATYACAWGCRHQELSECEDIIKSLEFKNQENEKASETGYR